MNSNFILLSLLFIFLPFIPAFMEALRGTDTQALKISNSHLKDSRHANEAIFWHLAHVLGLEHLEALREKLNVLVPTLLPQSLLSVPGGKVSTVPEGTHKLVSSQALELKSNETYLCKVLSMDNLTTGEGTAVHEAHALKTLHLAQKTKVVWWATGDQVVIHEKTYLPGKIQADTAILLAGNEIRFHQFQAPLMVSNPSPPPVTLPATDERNCPRLLFKKAHVIATQTSITGNLIAKKDLTLESGVTVFGSIKCHGNLILKSGSNVSGSIVALGTIVLNGDHFIGGNILSEKDITLGRNTTIGTPEHQVTLSAKNIVITGPFKAHGQIRAWKRAQFSS